MPDTILTLDASGQGASGYITLDLTTETMTQVSLTTGTEAFTTPGALFYGQLSPAVQFKTFLGGGGGPGYFPGAYFFAYNSATQDTIVLGGIRDVTGAPVLDWSGFDQRLEPYQSTANGPTGDFLLGGILLTPEPLVTVATPEPAAWLVMAAALIVAAGWRRVRALLALAS